MFSIARNMVVLAGFVSYAFLGLGLSSQLHVHGGYAVDAQPGVESDPALTPHGDCEHPSDGEVDPEHCVVCYLLVAGATAVVGQPVALVDALTPPDTSRSAAPIIYLDRWAPLPLGSRAPPSL